MSSRTVHVPAARPEADTAVAGPGRSGQLWTSDQARHYYSRLYPAALGMTCNVQDAEDLVQETFVKALAAARRPGPGTSIDAWLYRIMLNTYISGYRRRKNMPQLVAADDIGWQVQPLTGRGSAEEEAIGRMVDPGIVAAIRALPYCYRVTVCLADLEGLAYRQISDRTGMPLSSVRSCLHHGRRRLRDRLTAPPH